MHIRHSHKYGKEIKIIHPGEFYVSNLDEIIGTLLGSCVAVCLFDGKRRIAGMNHFMLPGRISQKDIFTDNSARYGITAINSLISSMEEKGSKKNDLTAKIFGGGHVLEEAHETASIPNDNIRLANILMEIDDIKIVKSDVGENYTRKLLMEVKTGKVFLKRSTKEDVYSEVLVREREFAKRSFGNE